MLQARQTCTPTTARATSCTASTFDVGEGEIVEPARAQRLGPLDHGQGHHGPGARRGLDRAAQGQEILGQKAFEIAHRGIGYVPENRDIFPKLTVHQNLHAGPEKRGKKQPRWSFDDMYRHVPAPEGARSTPRPACCRAASSRC